MALSAKQISKIKEHLKAFVDAGVIDRKENHSQYYSVEILKELGWKLSDLVIDETQKIKTGERPDILLIGSGGGTIFVIESKAPVESLDDRYKNKTFVEQLCNYIGSEGLSWGILTNFKEWRIYNSHAYKASKTIYKSLTIINKEKKVVCTDEQISDFFGLIENGFLNSKRGKLSDDAVYYPLQEEIKDEFFQNLKEWRKTLRSFLSKKEKNLAIEEVDFQTQKILDRLIFIDVCYDKKIISQDILGSILFSHRNFYDELKVKFRELDEKFNSELFSFEKCDEFDIPNEIMHGIIKGINRIDFSQLSVHIIGEVYENYLGEVLRSGKQKEKSTESKEHLKRKSQGIFYTPDYIVNYITETTIGERIKKCKSAKEIEKIKVLDTACGSGSFLIRAFELFYEGYKNLSPIKQVGIFDELNIRKKILLHNLFGVDFDERAVEIAKLNLLLKGLDGLEETYVVGRKILPNLSLNIRCGNSIVSGKYEDTNAKGDDQLSLLFNKGSEYHDDIEKLTELKDEFYKEEDNEAKDKIISKVHLFEEKINKYLNQDLKSYFKNVDAIKPFNYEVAFCEVMKSGGFDCIVGNPPYINIKNQDPQQKDYIRYNYSFSSSADLYVAFIEKGMNILRKDGRLCLIVPNKFFGADYGKPIRKYLQDGNVQIVKILDLKDEKVFATAMISTIVIDIKKTKTAIKTKLIHGETETIKESLFDSQGKIQIEASEADTTFIQHLEKNKPLSHYADVRTGIVGFEYWKMQDIIKSKGSINSKNVPIFTNGNLGRYINNWKNTEIKLYKDTYESPTINLDPKYLSVNTIALFKKAPKIIVRGVSQEVAAIIDTDGSGMLVAVHSIIPKKQSDIYYLLGIINSNLINWFHLKTIYSIRIPQGSLKYPVSFFETIPIPYLETTKIKEALEKLVKEMISLCKNPEKNKSKIDVTDLEINQLVYKLYSVSSEDQKSIETFLRDR
ncbi:MAG: Eco57I restriction-modification methylase domain-containing protein [Bacteroidota bacterium]